MAFIELDPSEYTERVFHRLDKEWGLLMAGDSTSHCNAMTVSLGGLGTFWSRPAITVYVRQSRFTRKFMDANDTFTLSFLPARLHDAHKVFGFRSGRDLDKTAATGLTPVLVDGTPVYEESTLTFVCRKALVKYLDPESFVDARAHEIGRAHV